MNPENFGIIIVAIISVVGLFFVFRSVVLWYFKIDEGLKLQQEILAELRKKEAGENNANY